MNMICVKEDVNMMCVRHGWLKRKIKTLLTLFLVSRQLCTSPYKGSKLWEAFNPTLRLKKKFLPNFRYIKVLFSHANQTQQHSPPTKPRTSLQASPLQPAKRKSNPIKSNIWNDSKRKLKTKMKTDTPGLFLGYLPSSAKFTVFSQTSSTLMIRWIP